MHNTVFHIQGELRRAERFLKLALDEAKQGFGLNDPHVAAATQNLAELYRVSRQYDLAGPLYEQVHLEETCSFTGPHHTLIVSHVTCSPHSMHADKLRPGIAGSRKSAQHVWGVGCEDSSSSTQCSR